MSDEDDFYSDTTEIDGTEYEVEQPPERHKILVKMMTDEYDPGEEFDFVGITMVRTELEMGGYYPKAVGPSGMVIATKVVSANELEQMFIEQFPVVE